MHNFGSVQWLRPSVSKLQWERLTGVSSLTTINIQTNGVEFFYDYLPVHTHKLKEFGSLMIIYIVQT